MSVALQAALARAGLRVSAPKFLSLLEEAASRLGTPEPKPAERFIASERTVLQEAGLDLTPLAASDSDPRARTLAQQAVLRDTALSVQQAAERVGVDPSRIRHRLGARQLVGWKDRAGWRLPSWQFTDRDVLPGLETVLAEAPDDQPALVLANFMTTPQEDLELDDRPVDPRQWLLAGGDPQRVADLASTIGTPA